MSDTVIIKSKHGEAGELRLRPCDRYSFYAEFISPVVLHAAVKVNVLSPVDLILFLNDLAKHWQDGESIKTWASDQGHMKLECTRNALGQVRLRVLLQGNREGAEWLAGGTLELATGDLEQVAQSARRILAAPSHAI
jgi:hypothetical protein